MKKTFLIIALCSVFSSLSLNASILFVSSCGEVTYTVDESYFDSKEEADKYYKDLDKILCEGKQTVTGTEVKEGSSDNVDIQP